MPNGVCGTALPGCAGSCRAVSFRRAENRCFWRQAMRGSRRLFLKKWSPITAGNEDVKVSGGRRWPVDRSPTASAWQQLAQQVHGWNSPEFALIFPLQELAALRAEDRSDDVISPGEFLVANIPPALFRIFSAPEPAVSLGHAAARNEPERTLYAAEELFASEGP